MILAQIKSHLQELRTQQSIAAVAAAAVTQIERVVTALEAGLDEGEKVALEVYRKANAPKEGQQ